MKFNSIFDIGDKVWVPSGNSPMLVTVGKIIIEYTDSPGLEGEELFDNFKPKQGYVEKYMCVETGIDTGSVWELNKNIFQTELACREAIKSNNK